MFFNIPFQTLTYPTAMLFASVALLSFFRNIPLLFNYFRYICHRNRLHSPAISEKNEKTYRTLFIICDYAPIGYGAICRDRFYQHAEFG